MSKVRYNHTTLRIPFWNMIGSTIKKLCGSYSYHFFQNKCMELAYLRTTCCIISLIDMCVCVFVIFPKHSIPRWTINPIHYGCTKHVELDYHYVHKQVALESSDTCSVSSLNRLVDILTKPLPKALFHSLCIKLGLYPDPQPCLRVSDSAAR